MSNNVRKSELFDKKARNRSMQMYITIEKAVNKCRHVCVTELDFDSQLSLQCCLKTISSGWTCNAATHVIGVIEQAITASWQAPY